MSPGAVPSTLKHCGVDPVTVAYPCHVSGLLSAEPGRGAEARAKDMPPAVATTNWARNVFASLAFGILVCSCVV